MTIFVICKSYYFKMLDRIGKIFPENFGQIGQKIPNGGQPGKTGKFCFYNALKINNNFF